jgi:predicted transposase YbfD/YdcC
MDDQATGEALPPAARIPRALEAMPDPRHHNIQHKLFDIITIALFAVLCGCDDWCAVAAYGQIKFQWLKTFLELPNGIPSHDTFNDVFARLNPDAFEQCFRNWMQSIEKLLEVLDIQGAVVTIDAIGCQRKIARKIRAAKAHYILQVKANQSRLQKMIARAIDEARLERFKGLCSDSDQQTDGDHGRIETRTVHVIWDVSILGRLADKWPGLKSIIAVQRVRQVNEHTSTEWHYYISSLDARRTARQIAEYIRGHWSVENNLHWQLDVSFDEDQRRIRKGHGAENFSRLCRLSLNLLKRETSQKVGIKTKRKICGWDNDYLLKVATT